MTTTTASDPSTYVPGGKPGEGVNVAYSDGSTKWQRDAWNQTAASFDAKADAARAERDHAEYRERLARDNGFASADAMSAASGNKTSSTSNGVPAGKAGEAPAAAVDRARAEKKAKKLQFPPSDIANMKYGVQFKFMAQNYEKQGEKAKFVREISGGHVFLPMPTNVMETLNVNYNVSELGAAGTLFEAGGTTADRLLGLANDPSASISGDDVKSAVESAMNLSGYVARRLISGVSQETGQALDMKLGTVVNPYTVAVFQSVAPRLHTLTFRLIPRSREDSIAIQAIVDTFKYHSMPSRSGDGATGGLFLRMPEEVEVAFFGTQFLFKFARCVINNVQVNHTPLGPASFFAGSDGAPVAVELTVSLQEIEQLTKESYGDAHEQYSAI